MSPVEREVPAGPSNDPTEHPMDIQLLAAALLAAPIPQQSGLSTDGLPLPASIPVAHDEVGPKERDPRVVQPAEADFAHEAHLVEGRRPGPADEAKDLSLDPESLKIRRWTELVYDDSADTVWVRGDGWKAAFTPAGMRYVPALGRAVETNQTFEFALESVTVGGEPLAFTRAVVARDGDSVTLDRGALDETYHLDLDVVEQTFVFDELPVRSEIVVDVAVSSPWTPRVQGNQLWFEGAGLGSVTYGDAFAYDAAGRRIVIPRVWTGESIRLTVPASFVETATFPLTIDPPIGMTFVNNFGTADDTEPDIAYDEGSQAYWITWEDYTSATDSDCYVTRVTGFGVQTVTLGVDLGTDAWRDPAIAVSRDAERALIVAGVETQGGSLDIHGRFIDTANDVLFGASFEIDGTSSDCIRPDVGGTWTGGSSQADFCVVWERIFSPTDHDILARLVDTTTGVAPSTIFLSNAGGDNDFAPAISQSQGDQSIFGDYWNVAWIRDDDGNGLGTPWSDRIYLDGTKNGSNAFMVFNTAVANRVDVTSTMDDELGETGDRPWIVTYYRNINGGDVYTTVCTQNASRGTNAVSELEDFDVSLDQREPRIAGNGKGFLLTYSELFWATSGTTDFDIYMVSGSIGETATGAYLALGESHQSLAFSGTRETLSAVCSKFDGGRFSNDGMAVWVDLTATSGGTLEGRRLLLDFPSTAGDRPVGLQYCAANGHNGSTAAGRNSSFISATGNQSVGSMHELHCDRMPFNVFAYFICSRTTGNVNMPGSSVGRLCLGGNIGRLVGGQILSSGSNFAVSTSFSPLSLPSPTGTVSAQVGETWAFQCWHRDTLNGQATSNFSNGCRIRFRP